MSFFDISSVSVGPPQEEPKSPVYERVGREFGVHRSSSYERLNIAEGIGIKGFENLLRRLQENSGALKLLEELHVTLRVSESDTADKVYTRFWETMRQFRNTMQEAGEKDCPHDRRLSEICMDGALLQGFLKRCIAFQET